MTLQLPALHDKNGLQHFCFLPPLEKYIETLIRVYLIVSPVLFNESLEFSKGSFRLGLDLVSMVVLTPTSVRSGMIFSE